MSDFFNIKYLKQGNEDQREAYKIVEDLNLETYLKDYKPTLVGTIPIGVNTKDSDLDILCEVDNFENFDKAIKNKYSHLDKFMQSKGEYQNRESLVYNFKYHNKSVEIFAQNCPIEKQNGYRHMVMEERLIEIFGLNFKNEITMLKKFGFKTEPAFCELLNLHGDSYDEILRLEDYSDDYIKTFKWENIFRKLPQFNVIHKIERIYKGWSTDRKYRIETISGQQYLLRISHRDSYEKKQIEFDNMKKVYNYDVILPKPIFISKESEVIALFEWVEGEDLDYVIDRLNTKQQYDLGYQAGKILIQIHSLSRELFDWYEKYNEKIIRVINDYRKCGIRFENDEKVMRFIDMNKDVLRNRPVTFQHGDYHLGNMIITPDEELGVIDFNRSSYGDPWEEYDRFVFTWYKSRAFANGQIKGYFDGEVPDDFFRAMAVYNATNILASIPWAVPFGEKDVQTMLKNAELVLETYDNFETYIPAWYKK